MNARLRLPARLVALAAIAAAATVAACTDVGTDPQSVVSFVGDTMPVPSVFAGDTLRDTLGQPYPLERLARAFNPQGAELPDAPVTLLLSPSDTGTVASAVAATASLAAASAGRTYLVVGTPPLTSSTAVIVNLQYSPGLRVARRIEIVARPDTMTQATATDTAVRFTTAATVTATFAVAVSYDSAGTRRPVRAALVRFETDSARRTTRIDSVRFDVAGRTGASRAVRYDTTDASGIASRALTVYRSTSALSAAPDTLSVIATTFVGTPLHQVTVTLRVPVSDSVATTGGIR